MIFVKNKNYVPYNKSRIKKLQVRIKKLKEENKQLHSLLKDCKYNYNQLYRWIPTNSIPCLERNPKSKQCSVNVLLRYKKRKEWIYEVGFYDYEVNAWFSNEIDVIPATEYRAYSLPEDK